MSSVPTLEQEPFTRKRNQKSLTFKIPEPKPL